MTEVAQEAKADSREQAREAIHAGIALIAAGEAQLIQTELQESAMRALEKAKELTDAADAADELTVEPKKEADRLSAQLAEADKCVAECAAVDENSDPIAQITAETTFLVAVKVRDRLADRAWHADQAYQVEAAKVRVIREKAKEALTTSAEMLLAHPFHSSHGQNTKAYRQNRMRTGLLTNVLYSDNKHAPEYDRGIEMLHDLLKFTGYGAQLEAQIIENIKAERGIVDPEDRVKRTKDGHHLGLAWGGMSPEQYRNRQQDPYKPIQPPPMYPDGTPMRDHGDRL